MVDLRLRGKVAVVTGASKGIGLAVTKAFVAEGVRVVAGARDVGGELAALADSGAVRAVAVDLSTPDGPQALVARSGEFGGLDILVNNIGTLALRLEGFFNLGAGKRMAAVRCGIRRASGEARCIPDPESTSGRPTLLRRLFRLRNPMF